MYLRLAHRKSRPSPARQIFLLTKNRFLILAGRTYPGFSVHLSYLGYRILLSNFLGLNVMSETVQYHPTLILYTLGVTSS